uniref:Uncharacterized protein n=1 Tax=Oryza punctata TaxID=4537 RepID=A0A0E0JZ78_ORYPU
MLGGRPRQASRVGIRANISFFASRFSVGGRGPVLVRSSLPRWPTSSLPTSSTLFASCCSAVIRMAANDLLRRRQRDKLHFKCNICKEGPKEIQEKQSGLCNDHISDGRILMHGDNRSRRTMISCNGRRLPTILFVRVHARVPCTGLDLPRWRKRQRQLRHIDSIEVGVLVVTLDSSRSPVAPLSCPSNRDSVGFDLLTASSTPISRIASNMEVAPSRSSSSPVLLPHPLPLPDEGDCGACGRCRRVIAVSGCGREKRWKGLEGRREKKDSRAEIEGITSAPRGEQCHAHTIHGGGDSAWGRGTLVGSNACGRDRRLAERRGGACRIAAHREELPAGEGVLHACSDGDIERVTADEPLPVLAAVTLPLCYRKVREEEEMKERGGAPPYVGAHTRATQQQQRNGLSHPKEEI